MDCRRVEELLPAFLENDIERTEAALVREHLASCVECSSSLELYRVLERSLEARAAEAPSWRNAFAPAKFAPARRMALPRRGNVFTRVLLSAPVISGFALAACGAAVIFRGERLLLWLQETAARLGAGAPKLSGDIVSRLPQFTPDEMAYLLAAYGGVAIAFLVVGRFVLARCMRR